MLGDGRASGLALSPITLGQGDKKTLVCVPDRSCCSQFSRQAGEVG